MKIIQAETPFLQLKADNQDIFHIDVNAFLGSIVKDKSSPYWDILDEENFTHAYIHQGNIIWPEVLNAMACSGETNPHNAVFTIDEILKHHTENSEQV
ncbi:hypothetical protein [Jiulongibacter sp. NS-SX5]|uniref:hypothetical protein n=1 Tax=Jiulongibacter sp. NS-SX5 TaxID=3463854 RepID=UPI0040591B7E